jgi:hypothetical protein
MRLDKAPGKFGVLGSCFGEVQQLFCNQIIECSLQPIAQLDALGGVLLLNPNLVPNAHKQFLATIIMPQLHLGA